MQKRIAAIHDLSCFGKCSLTVALPIVSCMGVECAVLPTALLSGHFAALKSVDVLDLTDRMAVIADQWAESGVEFDGIFSGYLGSAAHAEAVLRTRPWPTAENCTGASGWIMSGPWRGCAPGPMWPCPM